MKQELAELRRLLDFELLPDRIRRVIRALVDANAFIGDGHALTGCAEKKAGAYVGCVDVARCAIREAVKFMNGDIEDEATIR